MFAHLDYSKMFVISIHRKKHLLVPTLWHGELSESGQGDEGMGH